MLFTVFCENKYLPEETEKLNFSSRQFVTSRSTIPSFKYAEIQPQSCICSRDRYITHFYCLAVEAGFYSDVVECLPLDPVAQARFPPWAVGIFLRPVTFGGQYVDSTACVPGITQHEMSRNYSVVPSRFGD